MVGKASKIMQVLLVVMIVVMLGKPAECNYICCHNCYAKCDNGGSVDYSCLIACFGTCGGCGLDPPPAGTVLYLCIYGFIHTIQLD